MVYTSHRWASTAWLADTVASGAKSLRYGGSPPYKHGLSATTAHPGFWMLQAHAKPVFGGFACTSDDLPNIAHGEKGETSPRCGCSCYIVRKHGRICAGTFQCLCPRLCTSVSEISFQACMPGSAGASASGLMARLQAKAGPVPPTARAGMHFPEPGSSLPAAKAAPAAAATAAGHGQKQQPAVCPALVPLPSILPNASADQPRHAAALKTAHSSARAPSALSVPHDVPHAASLSRDKPAGSIQEPHSSAEGAKQPLQESNRQLMAEAASSASPSPHLLDSQVAPARVPHGILCT